MNELNVSSVMSPDPVSIDGDTSLDEALTIMDARGIRHLPVLERGALAGVISDRDLLAATGWLPARVHACRGPGGGDQIPRHVREIMHDSVVTVRPDDSLVTASVELLHGGVGCLPVVQGRVVVGMLTEIDLLDAYAAGSLGPTSSTGAEPPVAEHMTDAPRTIDLSTSLGDAIAICQSSGVRHLPVVEAGRLVGIVSDRDLRRAVGVGRHAAMPIDKIVTMGPVTVAPEAALSEAARVMAEHKFSALPVGDPDNLVGIVTMTDVLAHCLTACRDRRAEPTPGDQE